MSARSKYERIAADLRAAIDAGRLRPGDTTPSENELASRYGVNKNTARRALGALQQEGYTEARQGVANVVVDRSFRPIRRHGSRRLAAEQWGSGRSVWQVDLGDVPVTVDRVLITQATASDTIAALLDLGADRAVVVRRRRYLVAGRPVQLAVSSLPALLAAGTAITHEDTGPGGIYARLAELGHAPARFHEEIRARRPSDAERADLTLATGVPVIEVVRTAISADGRPVEVNEMVLDASAYVLEYDFDA